MSDKAVAELATRLDADEQKKAGTAATKEAKVKAKAEAKAKSEEGKGQLEPPPPSGDLILTMQQMMLKLDALARRADELEFSVRTTSVKSEFSAPLSPSPLPVFVPPTALANTSSSRPGEAGGKATSRHEQFLATALGDNRGMLMIAKEEAARLASLHDPLVSTSPPLTTTIDSSSRLTPPVDRRTLPSEHPLLHLPSRLIHQPISEQPSTAVDLLTSFLQERAKSSLDRKRIKSFTDWMEGMREALQAAIVKGNLSAVIQLNLYIELIVQFNTDYGWAAAEFYWYVLQKEVKAGFHSMATGSPWNARCFAAMTAQYPPLAGRHRSSTASSPPSSTSSSSRKPGRRDLECSYHGKHSSHTTAECKFLAGQKPGDPNPPAKRQ